jgi:hypothetical protein
MRRHVWVMVLLAIVTCVPAWHAVAAYTVPYHVIVDGEELRLEGQARIVSQRMLVPMERFLPSMGIVAIRSDHKSILSLYKDNKLLSLHMNEPIAYINGEPLRTEAVPIRDEQGRIWLPIRFIAQAFDAEVLWNGATQTVWIRTQSHNFLHPLAAPWETGMKSRAEIAARWSVWSPSYEGPPYQEVPEAERHPYVLGAVQRGLLQDGLNMANFVRYLAGLPSDLQLDPELNLLAQHGAVVLAAGKELTHYPKQPADMELPFFEQGYASTTTSNLALYRIFSGGAVDHHIQTLASDGPWTLAATVKQYMRDQDEINVPKLGHRRWILNPELKKVGFGFAHRSYSVQKEYRLDRYAVMQVFDKSRVTAVSYDTIAWPAEGWFPQQLLYGDDPWSVSLNPQVYAEPDMEEIKITLTRISDDQSWELDQADQVLTESEEYFNVNLQGYGVPYCLIFRPDRIEAYPSGEQYQVHIDGLRTVTGQSSPLEYTVRFFDLADYIPDELL